MGYLMGFIATVLTSFILFCMFLIVNTYGLAVISVIGVLYLSVFIALIAFMIKTN